MGEALRRAAQRLEGESETPRLDAQLLMGKALGRERAWVLAHPEVLLAPDQARALAHDLDRYVRGEPLPYLLGAWEFYGRRFRVGLGALIPRPETEGLVERAIAYLARVPEPARVVDVGTGSGCIAVTLACELPHVSVVAIDAAAEALGWASANVMQHGVGSRVRLVQADLCRPLARAFHLLCANLPYVRSDELERSARLRREPRSALDGGADGLDVLRRLIPMLPDVLLPGGEAVLEIGAQQGNACLALAEHHLPGWSREVLPDLSGQDRLLVLTRPA